MRFLDTPYGDITLWAYRPLTPFNEAYEWFNYSQDSYSGINRVTAFRNAPRHFIEMSSKIPKEKLNDTYHLLNTYKTGKWAVPLWTESVKVIVKRFSSSIVLKELFVNPYFQKLAIIWESENKWEIIEIEGQPEISTGILGSGLDVMLTNNDDALENNNFAVSASISYVIKTVNPIQNHYVNPSLIPLSIGKIISSVEKHNNSLSGHVKFLFQVINNVNYTPEEEKVTYEGYDVYTEMCSLFNSPLGIKEDTFKRMDIIDNSTGIISFNSPWDCSIRKRDYQIFNKTKQQYKKFKDFLFRRAGRYLPFWMPTWNDDLTLFGIGEGITSLVDSDNNMMIHNINGQNHAVTIGEQSDTIIINNKGFSFCRPNIAIKLKQGSWNFKKIISGQILDNKIYLKLNEPVDFEFHDVEFVSYLNLYRLGTDRVEIGHINNMQSVSSVPIVEMDIENVTVSCEEEVVPT